MLHFPDLVVANHRKLRGKTENLAHSKNRGEGQETHLFSAVFSKSANTDVQQPHYPMR